MKIGNKNAPLNQLAEEIHRTAIENGLWGDLSDYKDIRIGVRIVELNFGEVIALIHSEASEALEEYRAGHAIDNLYWRHKNGEMIGHPQNYPADMIKPEGVPIELADIIIRVLDACAAYGIDIDQAMREKMIYNKTRPSKHGGERGVLVFSEAAFGEFIAAVKRGDYDQ